MRLPKHIKIYGDTSYRGDCRSEEAEQKDFWGRLKERYQFAHRLAIHPKNEGSRDRWRAQQDRESGSLNTGASDIIIPASVSFVCELKRKDHTKSSISGEQVEYLDYSMMAGSFACIALGADAAEEALLCWSEASGVDIYASINKS